MISGSASTPDAPMNGIDDVMSPSQDVFTYFQSRSQEWTDYCNLIIQSDKYGKEKYLKSSNHQENKNDLFVLGFILYLKADEGSVYLTEAAKKDHLLAKIIMKDITERKLLSNRTDQKTKQELAKEIFDLDASIQYLVSKL